MHGYCTFGSAAALGDCSMLDLGLDSNSASALMLLVWTPPWDLSALSGRHLVCFYNTLAPTVLTVDPLPFTGPDWLLGGAYRVFFKHSSPHSSHSVDSPGCPCQDTGWLTTMGLFRGVAYGAPHPCCRIQPEKSSEFNSARKD